MSDSPSKLVRARRLAESSLALAVVPLVASFLAVGKLQRALDADPGFGLSTALPAALPTLWTYTGSFGDGLQFTTVAGAVSAALTPANAVVVLVGTAVFAALEAGFLGSVAARVAGEPVRLDRFLLAVRRFGRRMIVVRLVGVFVVVLLGLLAELLGPAVVLVGLLVAYALYGWPYVLVVRDDPAFDALGVTLVLAREGGIYLRFAVLHALFAAGLSVPLTVLVRNGGPLGVSVAGVAASLPALVVAFYGVLTFRERLGTAGVWETPGDTGPVGGVSGTSE